MQYRGMLRCGKWEEVCVRLCGSGSPQSTTAKRGHFVGYHGEGVTQSVPPNLAAELGRRWMFAISAGHCKGERFGGRCVSLQAAGKGEGVTQSVPPNLRALWNCPQKLNNMANDASRYRHKFARMVRPPSLPPSKNPAKRLGYCLVGGGGFERR